MFIGLTVCRDGQWAGENVRVDAISAYGDCIDASNGANSYIVVDGRKLLCKQEGIGIYKLIEQAREEDRTHSAVALCRQLDKTLSCIRFMMHG